MKNVLFLDTEVGKNDKKIYEFGACFENDTIKTKEISKIKEFVKCHEVEFVCGHNFIDHDSKFLSTTILNENLKDKNIIDTLLLSMLLFPNKKTHKLQKPYKTTINILNNPLGDALQTKALFELLDNKFDNLSLDLKQIFINLLYKNEYFNGYFIYKNLAPKKIDIFEFVKDKIECKKDDFDCLVVNMPLELAFIISFLFGNRKAAISHVIINKFPDISWILKAICFDFKTFDISKFALNEFGFDSFKEFDSIDGNGLFKISQEDIINSALNDNSLLTILPTGGGKTFTFLLPALAKAKAYNALTVVISPLQALMKNHVDSFEEKNQNFSVKAISSFLNPVQRANIIAQIINGTTDVLYLAPEALRSNSIFNALKSRMIDRFIIDEAHCFSSWGHDFRHDYHYIATFIKELNQNSNMQENIPVSCFTATAKPEVLNDIKEYFYKNLDIKFDEFLASSKRENLIYEAIEVKNENEKYDTLIKTLQNLGKIPTIIYLPQNARGCKELSQKLNEDARLEELNLSIEPFYAKIDDEIELELRKGRNKSEILKDFIDDKIDIVVATTAFGMGIDKPNIKAVIHYNQSDSLEAYLQESGRGARSKDIVAKCIILYQKEDFDKIFQKLNANKIDADEIQSIVKTLKKKKSNPVYVSPKALAKNSGINLELDYENIVKTALLELERCEILKRDRDKYTICGSSLIEKEKRNMDYIRNLLDSKKEIYKDIYKYMIMIMQNIIQKSKTEPVEIENLSSNISISIKDTFNAIYALQKENLINYDNDLSIFLNKKVKDEFNEHIKFENEIWEFILQNDKFDIRNIENQNSQKITKIKQIIQSFSFLAKCQNQNFNIYFYNFLVNIESKNKQNFENLLKQRQKICKNILIEITKLLNEDEKEIEFASIKLQNKLNIQTDFFHHCLVYLHQILKNFELRKGRLIYYKAYKIKLLDKINESTPYQKRRDYNATLAKYYERKIEAVHIQARFLELLTNNDKNVSNFIKDYFSLEYEKFKKTYNFDKNIKLPITKIKLDQILSSLNAEQKAIFNDDKSNSVMVLAGPGSGKTKTLVHKIASLITKEGNKPEYFLMLAHSRTAVSEFKNRLKKLIGNQIYRVKIFTFHAFALNLLSLKFSSNNELKNTIPNATKALQNKEIELPIIQMLVLDEYQDISKQSYEFIKEIYKNMSNDKKIIAVGDDDQCIMNFGENKADIKFINEFKNDFSNEHKTYNLLTNYRSCLNLVNFANAFRNEFKEKLKDKNLISNSDKIGKIELLQTDDFLSHLLLDINEENVIIARTNKEVFDIYSFLLEKGIKAKLLTDKNGFKLKDLLELQIFSYYFDKFGFKQGFEKFKKEFINSANLALTFEIIEKFQNEYDMNENEKYLKSAFYEFIEIIDFDEFENTNANVIISTMHKVKGKEFDNVHLCFGNNVLKDEYEKRLLYVAVTRAKNNLFIYSKNEIFTKYQDFFTKISHFKDQIYTPKKITLQMDLSDVFLSNELTSKNVKNLNLQAGNEVEVKFDGIYKNKFVVCKFSNKFKDEIQKYKNQGYKLDNKTKINYVVVWEDEKNFRVILCNIKMNLIKNIS